MLSAVDVIVVLLGAMSIIWVNWYFLFAGRRRTIAEREPAEGSAVHRGRGEVGEE